MSKEIILTLFFIFSFLIQNSICQENDQLKSIDQRLVEFYGEKYILELSKKSPNQIEYLTYFLDNSYYITDVPFGKADQITDVSEVNINTKYSKNKQSFSTDVSNLNNFNVLKYQFKRELHKKTIYKFGNTDKMIVFYSQDEFVKAYNEYLNRMK